jgi:hypothetical protein
LGLRLLLSVVVASVADRSAKLGVAPALPLLLVKLLLPLYVAVIVTVAPDVRPVKSTVALPPTRDSVAVSAEFPSLNVTAPVGVPEPGEFALTVAVAVTSPRVEVAAAETRSVVES